MPVYVNLFLVGLALGWGPCLVSCAPLLLPYIAATKGGWKEGLNSALIFTSARLTAYVLLGLLVGISSELTGQLVSDKSAVYIQRFGGVFLCMLGLVIIMDKDYHLPLCRILQRQFLSRSGVSMFILGFITGVLPCLPLLGVLSYIALTAKTPVMGAFYGLAFGVGNSLSPLIPLGILAGIIPKAFEERKIIIRICGFLLIFAGIHLAFFK
jgi:sulfite exporter TauE/SafE